MSTHQSHNAGPDGGCVNDDVARSPVSMFAYDADMTLRWVKNPPLGMAGDGFMTVLEGAMIEGVSRRDISDALRWVQRTGETFYGFCALTLNGIDCRFEVTLSPHTKNEVMGVATNMGLQEPRERAVRSLSLELAHRTKNLMAIITSLATQTSRRFHDPEEFKNRFVGQIGSLSRAHDAIAHTGWNGASLDSVVKSQINRDPPEMELILTGDALGAMLTPNAAQNIAMVLHDLASACKAGARFQVDGSFEGDDCLRLVLTTMLPVNLDGLWRVLLEKVAPLSLGGTGEIVSEDSTFRYELCFSDDHFTRP